MPLLESSLFCVVFRAAMHRLACFSKVGWQTALTVLIIFLHQELVEHCLSKGPVFPRYPKVHLVPTQTSAGLISLVEKPCQRFRLQLSQECYKTSFDLRRILKAPRCARTTATQNSPCFPSLKKQLTTLDRRVSALNLTPAVPGIVIAHTCAGRDAQQPAPFFWMIPRSSWGSRYFCTHPDHFGQREQESTAIWWGWVCLFPRSRGKISPVQNMVLEPEHWDLKFL